MVNVAVATAAAVVSNKLLAEAGAAELHPVDGKHPFPRLRRVSTMDKEQIYETLNEAYFSEAAHEAEVIANIGRLVKGAHVLVDAGASLGQYTRAFSQNVNGAAIYSYEADPTRYEELERNCEKWVGGSSNTITAYHAALTDSVREITFYVTNSNLSGGITPHDVAADVDWEAITVPARTLDHDFPSRIPDFVKIDVEGAELSVLRGATRILATGHPTFLIELHGWEEGVANDVRELMRRNGYRSVSFFGQTVFLTDRRKWLRLKALELRRVERLQQRSLAVVRRALGRP